MSDPATLNLDTLFDEMMSQAPASTLSEPEQASMRRAAQRSGATARNRKQVKAHHDETLASVGGDREKLKTITLWVPRSQRRTIFARGFSKTHVGSLKRKDDEDHDESGKKALYSHSMQEFEAEIAETVYDLTEIEVERAGPPAQEVDYAKLQGRFKAHVPSIQGFFAPNNGVRYATDVTSHHPLGDFEWCEDLVPREERLATRARYPAKNNQPVTCHAEGAYCAN